MFSKTYDWTSTFLWIFICLTLLLFGWSILYASYSWSLSLVSVLLTLCIIQGYIQYMKILSLKRKFIIAQETVTTVALIYFSFCCFSDKNEMTNAKILKKAQKKLDDVYNASRFHLSVQQFVKAFQILHEIKNTKGIVKTEMKKFTSTDGFNAQNAQIIASDLMNLFQKIKQFTHIVVQGMPSKKKIDSIMGDNLVDEFKKGIEIQSSAQQKKKSPIMNTKNMPKTRTRIIRKNKKTLSD